MVQEYKQRSYEQIFQKTDATAQVRWKMWYLIWFIGSLLILFTAASCSPQIIITPVDQIAKETVPLLSATFTTEPTATATPEPTATATPEPTATPVPSANDIASQLELDLVYANREGSMGEMRYGVEHTYSFAGTKDGLQGLRDENGNWKAIKEQTGWRALDLFDSEDAERMYGEIVPEGESYLERGFVDFGLGLRNIVTYPIYLGDWFTRSTTDQDGNSVTLYYITEGQRTTEKSELRIVIEGVDLAGEGHEHRSKFGCTNEPNLLTYRYFNTPVELITTVLKPGMQIKSYVPYPAKENQNITIPPYEIYNPKDPLHNNSVTRMGAYLLNREPERNEGLSIEEAEQIIDARFSDSEIWPNPVVINHRFFGVVISNIVNLPHGNCDGLN